MTLQVATNIPTGYCASCFVAFGRLFTARSCLECRRVKICVVCRALPGQCWSCDNKRALRDYRKVDDKTIAVLEYVLLAMLPDDLIDIVWQYGVQPTKWVCGTYDLIYE